MEPGGRLNTEADNPKLLSRSHGLNSSWFSAESCNKNTPEHSAECMRLLLQLSSSEGT